MFSGKTCKEGESCTNPDHVVVNGQSKIEPKVVILTKKLTVRFKLHGLNDFSTLPLPYEENNNIDFQNPQVNIFKSNFVTAGQDVAEFNSTLVCAKDAKCIIPESGKVLFWQAHASLNSNLYLPLYIADNLHVTIHGEFGPTARKIEIKDATQTFTTYIGDTEIGMTN